jgi:predicted CoA-binding protein
MNEPETIRHLLRSKTIAVIGATGNPAKPSHFVPAHLQSIGHRILPVNPSIESALGEKSYPSLAELPLQPDLVNVFRLPRFIPAIVDQMIELYADRPNPPALWIQTGIRAPEAAAKAEAHGIRVVMDRCLMVESRRAAISLREPQAGS